MKTLYTKINDRYDRRYWLSTAIVSDGDRLYVTKSAMVPEAQKHLQNMALGYEAFDGWLGKVELCPVKAENGQLMFDYIEGENGWSLLLDTLRRKGEEAFCSQVCDMLDLLPEAECAFVPTAPYIEMFGEAKALEGVPAYRKILFDYTANNLIYRDGHPVYIDYEWYLPFQVPKDLIRLHFIECMYLNYPELESSISKNSFYDRIQLGHRDALEACWKSFHSIIKGQDSPEKIYGKYLKKSIPVNSSSSGSGMGQTMVGSRESTIISEQLAWIKKQEELLEYKDAQIAERGKQIAQYGEVVAEKEKAIETKDTWIAEQQKLLEYKDAQIAERGKQIAQYGEVVAEKEKAIETKDTWIAEQQRLLEYKDAQIAERGEQIAQYGEVVAEKEKAIETKDAWIAEQQKLLEFKDAQIAERGEQIAQYGEVVAEKEKAIETKDAWIEKQTGMLEFVQEQLLTEQDENESLNRKLEKCQLELTALRQRIFNIENSKFWQRTKRWHKGL